MLADVATHEPDGSEVSIRSNVNPSIGFTVLFSIDQSINRWIVLFFVCKVFLGIKKKQEMAEARNGILRGCREIVRNLSTLE